MKKNKSDRAQFFLVVPPSPQIPTPGREFFLKAPIEGPSYIATVLDAAGYEVTILDFRHQAVSIDPMIRAKNPVVGIATFADSYCFLEEFIAQVKDRRKDIPIILGGPFVSSAPRPLMEHLAADYAVLGEGEETIRALVEMLEKKDTQRLGRIPGILFKEQQAIVATNPRSQRKRLDSLPFLNLSLWKRGQKPSLIRNIGLSSTRGCYGNCSFCYKTIPQISQMSPVRFAKQVRQLIQKYQTRFVYINDLTFILSRKRTEELCGQLKKLNIQWACSTRVEGIEMSLLKKMREAGCQEIWFGIESVDQRVLNRNFKKVTVEQINRAVNLTHSAGIKVMGNFIVGLLGEDSRSLQKMMDFIQTKPVIPCSIKYLTPFPGTYIYDFARKKGLIKDEIEYFRQLGRRKVNSTEDEIINCTSLPEEQLRQAFKAIRELSYARYRPLQW